MKNQKKRTMALLSTGFTVAVIAVVALVNLAAGILEERFSLRVDLTDAGLYELSEQTVQLLDTLEEPVTVTVLAEQTAYSQGVRTGVVDELLHRYQAASHGFLQIRYVDPYRNPGELTRFQNETLAENDLVVEAAGQHRHLAFQELFENQMDLATLSSRTTGFRGEQALTGALAQLVGGEIQQVYLLEGHGESYPDQLGSLLEGIGCQAQSLSLQQQEVPEDAALLMLRAPQVDFSAQELSRLDQYLAGGGRLMVFYGANSPQLPELEGYFQEWGVGFLQAIAVDPTRSLGNLVQLSPLLIEHPLNANCAAFPDRFLLTPEARPIELLWETEGNRQAQVVLVSGEDSYAKAYGGEDGQVIASLEREEGDPAGPLNLGVLTSDLRGQVLFLSAPEMLDDSLLQTANLLNEYYLLNAVSYLTGSETQVVSIPSRSMGGYALQTVGLSAGGWFFLVVCLPSAVILAAGIWTFLRRRKL